MTGFYHVIHVHLQPSLFHSRKESGAWRYPAYERLMSFQSRQTLCSGEERRKPLAAFTARVG